MPATYLEAIALARRHEQSHLALKDSLKVGNPGLSSIRKPEGMWFSFISCCIQFSQRAQDPGKKNGKTAPKF